jgi:hypothetical protein
VCSSDLQYDTALETYNQAKEAVISNTTLLNSLKNPNLSPEQIIQRISNTPGSQLVASGANINPEQFIQEQTKNVTDKLNRAVTEQRKAEKEVQKLTKYINGLQSRISVITNQLQIAITAISLKKQADNNIRIVNNLVKVNGKKIRLNGILLNKKVGKVVKTVAKAAAIYAIAKLLNSQINKLSKDVQRLGELVDKTNTIIQSIQTKQDIQKAKAARDSALVALAACERKLTQIRKIISTLQTLLFVLKLVLFLITLIPTKTRPKRVRRIVKAMLAIDAATVLVGTGRSVLDNLIAEIQYQRSRLLPIGDIIDNALNNNLSPDEIQNLLNNSNYGKLGPLDGVVYRGFTFAILEEEDPRFVVAGNKRRYAVAYDRSGFITLRSDASFTLDPEVLVNELKLIIDEQNLEP